MNPWTKCTFDSRNASLVQPERVDVFLCPIIPVLFLQELFDKKGVVFLPSIEKIVDYQGEESAAVLKSVRLSDGTTLDLDLLIVGIG